ncbi:MAG: hypothetical protein ABI594_03730 [Ginsengibacter sp.]
MAIKSACKRYLQFMFFTLLTVASTAQTRDDVNKNNAKPKDTSQPKRPRYVNVDTVKAVPVETKTLVRSVLRLKNIYPTTDAIAICRILNPEIYRHDSTLSNHTIILPYLPDPPSDLRKSIKDNFKKELKPDAQANDLYSAASLRFDTLANVFSVTDFSLIENDSGNVYNKIKKYLPPLANLAKRAAKNARRTSQKTVNMLTKEVDALNKILRQSSAADSLVNDDMQKIYSLMQDINTLVYLVNDKEMQIDSLAAINRNVRENIYLAASYTVPVEYPAAMSGDDDPQKFNIYVFKKSILEATGERNPEMDLYTISYVIPALASDPDEWNTIPKMASTTSESFAPARFTFSIKDNRTGKSYEATADLFDAAKDPNEKWTLMDLFNPHPVYRLMFLIP